MYIFNVAAVSAVICLILSRLVLLYVLPYSRLLFIANKMNE